MPKIMAALPIFFSVFIAASLVWYFNVPKLSMPLCWASSPAASWQLDNRLTGRLKNIVFTVYAFSIASLSVQLTVGKGLPFMLSRR